MVEAIEIRLQGLAKDFGTIHALKGIDLEVSRGEVFGFLGPNGAGKTTTIRILLDFIRPSVGRAMVAGFDCQSQASDVHAHLGYIGSDPSFYEGMSANDFFDLIAEAKGGNLDATYRDGLIERFDLDPTRRLHELSRGNRQKVGLIQAFMCKAPVIILDEPTTGLDPLMQEVVAEVIREIASDGRTVFLSSHFLAEAEKLCDRAAILRKGEIVRVFDVEEERRSAPQHATVVLNGDAEAGSFDNLPGIRVTAVTGSRFTFEVRGGIDPLIKRLASFSVQEFLASEVSLEDLFMSYYEGAEDGEPT